MAKQFTLNKKQLSRIDEMLDWFEMSEHLLPTPNNRRRDLTLPIDRRGTGFLTGAMSTGTASVSVNDVNTIYGPPLVASSSETMTVFNTHGWEGDNEAFGRFEFNRSTTHFEFYAINCPTGSTST